MLVNFVVDTNADEAFDGGDLAAEAADGGGLSLREAIGLANQNDGGPGSGDLEGDTIAFALTAGNETIVLALGELTITDDLVIDGTNDAVSGNGGSAAFGNVGSGVDVTIDGGAVEGVGGSRILLIEIAADNDLPVGNGAENVHLSNLVLRNGNARSGDGGAILNATQSTAFTSTLVIDTVTFEGNTAAGAGGAIANTAETMAATEVDIVGSTFVGNSAGTEGGAIANLSAGRVDIADSTLGRLDEGDYWRRTVNDGELIFALVGGQNSVESTDPVLAVRGGDGSLIEQDDEDGFALDAVVAGAAAPAGGGIVQFEVRERSDELPLGPYDLFVSIVDPSLAIPEDESVGSAGNDRTSDANPIVEDTLVTGSVIAGSGDRDYFSFSAEVGDTIVVMLDEDPDDDGHLTYIALNLVAGNGSTVLARGDTAFDHDGNATLPYVVENSGTFFVWISNSGLNSDDEYRFVVQIQKPADRILESEPNDEAFEADELADNGEYGSGRLGLGVSTAANTAVRGGAIYNAVGTMAISDSDIVGNRATGDLSTQGGGGVFNDGGTLHVVRGNVDQNAATGASGTGGGLFSMAGTVTLTTVDIERNEAVRAGGGIEVVDGTLTATDIDLNFNDVSDDDRLGLGLGAGSGKGGGLHITGAANVTIDGGIVRGNVAQAEGGGLWNSSTGTLTVVSGADSTNVEIDDNEARGNADPGATGSEVQGGGGIFNDGGRLMVLAEVGGRVSIFENRATGAEHGSGGGILSVAGDVTVTGYSTMFNFVSIFGNDANRAGGGLEIVSGSVTLTNVAVNGNDLDDLGGSGPGIGGGLHITSDAYVVIDGGRVGLNDAKREGGGLWNSATGTLIVRNGTRIHENRTLMAPDPHDGGGGIFNDGGHLIVDGTKRAVLIEDNDATGGGTGNAGGGGILSVGGHVELRSTTILGNTAERAGGGIEVVAGTAVLEGVEVLLNEATIGGGIANGGDGTVVVSNSHIGRADDRVDVWKRSAEAGDLLFALVDGQNSVLSNDPVLTVRESDGTLIEQDVEDGFDRDAVVAGASTVGGDVFFEVRENGDDQSILPYELYVSVVDPLQAVSEDESGAGNDTLADANPIVEETLIVGDFSNGPGDRDFYSFTANAGDTVVVMVDDDPDDDGFLTRTTVDLLTGDGTRRLAMGDNNPDRDGNALEPFLVETTGTYILRIIGGATGDDEYQFVLGIHPGADRSNASFSNMDMVTADGLEGGDSFGRGVIGPANPNVAVRGGGVFNAGTLHLLGSVVDGNRATGDDAVGGGGGIYNAGGTVELGGETPSIIARNLALGSGGGLATIGGDVTFDGAEVRNNVAVRDGGGIDVRDGEVVFVNSQLVGNRAEGSGVLLLEDTFTDSSLFSVTKGAFFGDLGAYFGIADGNGDGGADFAVQQFVAVRPYVDPADNFLTGRNLGNSGFRPVPVEITYTDIDIRNFDGLRFLADFASYDDGAPGDIDMADFIRVEVRIDGDGDDPFTEILEFRGNGPFGRFAADTDGDDIGDGAELGSAFAVFERAVLGTGDSLDLRLTFSVDASFEDFAIDNVRIVGGSVIASSGGGAHVDGETANMEVVGSLVAGNESREGGGFWVGRGANVSIEATTIDGNVTMAGNGGGIHNSGTLSVRDSTVSANSAVSMQEPGGGSLELVESLYDDQDGIDGLNGTSAAAFSGDGRHVYVTSHSDDSITLFLRDASTGELTFVESLYDEADGIPQLGRPTTVVVSPDGAHVYVGDYGTDALALFERDATTGRLTFVEALIDNEGGVDGLDGITEVSLSPDGAHLYATGHIDDAVAVFARDASPGRLTFVEARINDQNGVEELDYVRTVAVSGDGVHVYVGAGIDDSVAVFERDATTGRLTFVEALVDGVDGVDGLEGVFSVVVSGDGKHVYVAGGFDDAIVVFERNPATGRLSFVETRVDGVGGVAGLERPQTIVISADGRNLYAASDLSGAVTVFSRDAATGRLAFVGVVDESDIPDLLAISEVAISPDGGHVLALSGDRDVLHVFARETVTTIGGQGGGIAQSGTASRTTLVNVTVSGNDADEVGGGLFADNGTLDIESTTIADNHAANDGGGLFSTGTATFTLHNTTIGDQPGGAADRGNSAGRNGEDVLVDGGAVDSLGFNLVADAAFVFSNGNQGTDIIGGDPDLAALADNGGPTFTHLPGATGDAVGNGNSTETTDQRGLLRPQGAQDDIGAVELVNTSNLSLIGLRGGSTLVIFAPNDPTVILATVEVTGLGGIGAEDEQLIGIDTSVLEGMLYGVTDANGLYTIDPVTGVATLVDILTQGLNDDDLVAIAAARHFHISSRGLFEDSIPGLKWIRGDVNEFGNPWYFIDPFGNLFASDGTNNDGDLLLARLGTNAYENLELIVGAGGLMASNPGELAAADQMRAFYRSTRQDFQFNDFGGNEKWIKGRVDAKAAANQNNPWYFILPTGAVFEWDGTPGTLSGTQIGITPDPTIWEDPSLLFDAFQDPTVNSGGFDDLRNFVFANVYNAVRNIDEGFGGLDAKWFLGDVHAGGNDWYFLLPNGDLFEWDGTPNTASGNLLGNLGPNAWNNIERVVDDGPGVDGRPDADQLMRLDQELELYRSSRDRNYFSTVNPGLKWFRGKINEFGNPWYFVNDAGELRASAGGGASSLIEMLSGDVFDDPSLLVDAYADGSVRNTEGDGRGDRLNLQKGLDGAPVGLDVDLLQGPMGLLTSLQLVSTNNLNLNIDARNGETTVGPNVNPGAARLAAIAFDGLVSFNPDLPFVIDSLNPDTLNTLNPANGQTSVVGALNVDSNDLNGLEAIGDPRAVDGVTYASLTVGGTASLYMINTTTGNATLVGLIGTGFDDLHDITQLLMPTI